MANGVTPSNAELNNSLDEKIEIIKISTDLYEITLKVENRLLKFIIPLQVVINGILLYFDFKGEWIVAIVNALVMFFFLFIFSKIRNNGDDIESFLDRIKQDWPKGNLDAWMNIINRNFRHLPIIMKFFFGTESFGKVTKFLETLESRVYSYVPPPSQSIDTGANNIKNSSVKYLAYALIVILSLVAFVIGLGKTKETLTNGSKHETKSSATTPSNTQTKYAGISDSVLYTIALKYANMPSEEKITYELVQINDSTLKDFKSKTKNNKTYITVYSVKQTNEYYPVGKFSTKGYYNWVFTKRDFFDKYKIYAKEDSVYRVKQLLGLPPGYNIQYVIEFQVDPKKDLFRPCPDAEMDDCNCDLTFPFNTTSEHRKFINEWHRGAYNNMDLNKNYPFTQLGYTLDWNPYNFSHIGVSEFVINRYKEVAITNVYAVRDFLAAGPEEKK